MRAYLANVLLFSASLVVSAHVDTSRAQQPASPAELAPGLRRLEGIDAATGTSYVLVLLSADKASATLIAQCTSQPDEHQHFELFVDLKGNDTADPGFRAHHKRLPTEAQTIYTTLTLDFRGYTHVKPFHREFEVLKSGELRYNPPGMHSKNLEEAAWFLQYLRALPTLVFTEPAHPDSEGTPVPERTATFQTEMWLAQLRKEPLCKSSGL